MSAGWWSDDLRPLSELVGGLGEFVREVGSPDAGTVMTVERLALVLPLEVRVATSSGAVSGVTVASPERTATSFPPSVHRLEMRIFRHHAG